MDAITAAQHALVFARHALSKYKSANKRPALVDERSKEMWTMTYQSSIGAKGKLDAFRTNQDYSNIVWNMAQVLAYGKAAAKLGAGNCMEFAAVACVKLSTLQAVPNYYAVELGGGADHVFVAIGQDPDLHGAFPQDFANWAATAAICDPWANIACLAGDYPQAWRDKMDKWYNAGKELPKAVIGHHFGGMSVWISPNDPYWRDAIADAPKRAKTEAGTGKDASTSCCYITTAVCRDRGLPDDCEELRVLRRFRDEVLLQTADGRRDVAEYYRLAPPIVAMVARRPDARELLNGWYGQYIRPAVDAAKHGRYGEAHALFRELTHAAGSQYL